MYSMCGAPAAICRAPVAASACVRTAGVAHAHARSIGRASYGVTRGEGACKVDDVIGLDEVYCETCRVQFCMGEIRPEAIALSLAAHAHSHIAVTLQLQLTPSLSQLQRQRLAVTVTTPVA